MANALSAQGLPDRSGRRRARGPAGVGSAPTGSAPGDRPAAADRILIADSSTVLTELLHTAITTAGHEARAASTAEEAMALLRGGEFGLVILDTALAGAEGRSLLRMIRGAGGPLARVPVIVLTDRADRASVLAALSLHVSGYILKSQFRLELLLDRVRLSVGGAGRATGAGESTGESDGAGGESPPPAEAGAASADLRGLRPLLSRAEVEERLRGCEQLRAFSPSVSRVLALTGAPGASMDAVVAAVGQDHAIALKLLKLANSAALSTGEPVDSVKKAVLRMGLEKVRQAVLNIGVVERYSSAAVTEQFNFANFWEHSISCGLIAAELAAATKSLDPDNAFAMGLLHDVGRVALIEQLPDEYARVLEAAQRLEVPVELAESRLLLMSHAELMGRLLRTWSFPKDLVEPIMLHHASVATLRGMSPGRAREVAVLALANRLAHALLLGSSGNDVVYPGGGLPELLGVNEACFARIESVVPQETDRIKMSLLAVGSGEQWPRVRDRHRAALERPLRPLFVAPDADRDPLRIFCATLADEGQEGAPNVAIVHLPDARARAEAANRLRAAEAQAGVGPLPLIVLSPEEMPRPPAELIEARVFESVHTPVAVARFTKAVNRVAGLG